MFNRKACSAFSTSMLAPLLCVLWLILFDGESITGFLALICFNLWFASIFLSEFLTKKISGSRPLLTAFLIHVSFGVAFTFIFTFVLEPDLYQSGHFFNDITLSFFWGATLSSLLFWAVDEYIRCKQMDSGMV